MKSRKIKCLDIYRLIAMLLVSWTHLVGTGLYAYDVPGVINGSMSHTILDPVTVLGRFDAFLYGKFHTDGASIGVAMFFVCTGFLIPGMLTRYDRKSFMVNRICRIFPCLLAAVLLISALVYIGQGILFTPAQIITSATLTYQLFSVQACLGVLWTLSIEMTFYILAALIKKISPFTCAIVFMVIFLLYLAYEGLGGKLIYNLFYNMRYIGFCVVGSTVYLAYEDKTMTLDKRAALVGGALVANLVLFRMNKLSFGDDSLYPNLFTHLIPLALLVLLMEVERRKPSWFEHIPKIFYHVSALCYPFYLVHVAVGLLTMYYLRNTLNLGNGLIVLGGFAASFAVAELLAALFERPSIRLSRWAIANLKSSREQGV